MNMMKQTTIWQKLGLGVRRLGLLNLSCLVAMLLSAPCSRAQLTTTGTITGTVTDSTGAGVPRASVSITNEGTGIESKTMTNASGSFAVAGLSPGTYTVKVSKQGFETYLERDIILHPTQVATVSAVLKIG
jgi:uncharacterized membrane protein